MGDNMKTKMRVIAILLTWCFILAIIRLLVIISDKKYSQVSTAQSFATVEVAESRGTIYDRNKKSLTNATQYYRAAVVSSPQAIACLSELLNDTAFSNLTKTLRSGKPAVVSCGGYFSAVGAYVHRYYSYYSEKNVLAAHMLGYLDSEGNGVCGIEKSFNSLLKAKEALKVSFCLDARGNALAGVDPIVTGEEAYSVTQGVVTTLDSKIQSIVEEESSKFLKKGAVVVLDVGSGEICASASFPTYEVTNVAASLTLEDSPFINRALTAYNVGSVFKLCVAAAALEHSVTAQEKFYCNGFIEIDRTRYYCNNRKGHGRLDMEEALCKSCNCYFIQLAQKIGAKAVFNMTQSMGFGKKQELCEGLFGSGGTIPRLEDLLQESGALVNLSFGQGVLMATPLQVTAMTAAIANGGLYTAPSLIQATMNTKGELTPYATKKTTRIMSVKTAALLRQMMVSVVERGTGSKAACHDVTVGGKTATAETGWYIDGRAINQAWFTGFASQELPQYAITILAEDGVSGASSAAPLFSSIVSRMKAEGIL